MEIKLTIDKEKIDLNEFVAKFMSGTIIGAVGSLRDIPENWQEIKIEIRR